MKTSTFPFFLLLILLFCRCPNVRGAYDWLVPGSYAVYDLTMRGLVRLNETCLVHVGGFNPNETTVARYGFSVVEVDGDYALLRVSLNESSVLPFLFNTSSLSCTVWVDLETRDLVDRDTGEVWGKCPFWVYPWEADTSVTALYDFFGAKIVWDNVTKLADSAARMGVYNPSRSFSTPIGYFNEFDFIITDYGMNSDQPLIDLENVSDFYQGKIRRSGTYGFSPSIQYFYHVENGLLLFADSLYADDILAKNFGIIMLNGMLSSIKPEYSGERVGWLVGPTVIYDTNILRGSDKPTVGGGGSGFPWYVPLSIAVVALLPLVYYVYVRRFPKHRFSPSSLEG